MSVRCAAMTSKRSVIPAGNPVGMHGVGSPSPSRGTAPSALPRRRPSPWPAERVDKAVPGPGLVGQLQHAHAEVVPLQGRGGGGLCLASGRGVKPPLPHLPSTNPSDTWRTQFSCVAFWEDNWPVYQLQPSAGPTETRKQSVGRDVPRGGERQGRS